MFDQQSCSTLAPVSTWIGAHWQMGKPYRYVTNHSGQLSLGRHNEYQQRLGHKQAHCAMH